MALPKFVLILTIFELVHGYTPTFRNEATHPLKAPTESTLGLQINDNSATGTKTNIPKQEAVVSGGKHFEYMLLNDSNILLTSLQNDSPFETGPAKQTLPHSNSTTDSLKSGQIEATFSPYNNTAENKANVTTRIISETNFKVDTPPPRALPSTLNTANVSQPALERVHQFFNNFRRASDVSSTTKLYSKQANNSEEDFASFTSPLTASLFVALSQMNIAATPKPMSKSSPKQAYDYDDSFTKLLISNGILKPNNNTESETLTSQRLSTKSNPSIKDINRIMDSSIPLMANNTNLKNGAVSRSRVTQNVGATLDALTKGRSPFIPAPPLELNKEKTADTILIKSSTIVKENSNGNKTEDKIIAKISIKLADDTIFTSKATSHDKQNYDESISTSTRKTEVSSDHSNSIQFDRIEPTKIDDAYTLLYEATERKQIFGTAGSSNTDVSNENPLAVKPYTDSSVKIKSHPHEPFPRDVGPLEKFNNPKSFHGIRKKSENNVKQQLTMPEFEVLLKQIVSHLFKPLIKHLYKNPNETVEPVHLKRFTLLNITNTLKHGFTAYFEEKINRLSTETTPSFIAKKCSVIWRNILDNETFLLDRSAADLFDEAADFFWFALPMETAVSIPLNHDDLMKDLKTDYAVRFYLEYKGKRINSIFILPRPFSVNVNLSSSQLNVDVSEEVVALVEKTNSVREFDGNNVTLFEYGSQKLHVLQLGRRKLPDQTLQDTARLYLTSHDDIEIFICILLGSVCTFCFLSLILYAIYRVIQAHPPNLSFRMPDILMEKYNFLEPSVTECKSDPLNVIFTENFDEKFGAASWLDNSQHTSSILKPCKEMSPAAVFNDEAIDQNSVARPAIIDSPRVNKENKLNMLGCRSYCILLPHSRTYLTDSENERRYFDNPNYGRDTR